MKTRAEMTIRVNQVNNLTDQALKREAIPALIQELIPASQTNRINRTNQKVRLKIPVTKLECVKTLMNNHQGSNPEILLENPALYRVFFWTIYIFYSTDISKYLPNFK